MKINYFIEIYTKFNVLLNIRQVIYDLNHTGRQTFRKRNPSLLRMRIHSR